MKKIATIIVTFNGEKWIKQCLETILESSYPSEIFVVDNRSTDRTVDLIKNFPVHLEVLNENKGFGFANNFVLKKIANLEFDFFFLINQDLYVEENSLEQLVKFSENHPDFGIIAPIQFDGKGEKIDTNFQQYIKLSKEKNSYYETQFCNAAAWLLTRKCVEKVGIFNENFQHYGEDRNYCERATFHQFKIGIIKNTKVLHDRDQKMTTEKAVKLAKIKLFTIFLDPNKSKSESIISGFINVFGISKYLFKKYKSFDAVFQLFPEYIKLFRKKNELEKEKLKLK